MNAMPPIAPLPLNQRNIDVDHLNLLSIFYFVAGGLAFLGSLFLVFEFTIMQFVLSNPSFWQHQRQAPPAGMFAVFHMMIWLYLVLALFMAAAAILNILCGIFLRTRKHRTFSFIIAALNCLQVPLGTILGVFTIVVLTRNSVRDLYEVEKTG